MDLSKLPKLSQTSADSARANPATSATENSPSASPAGASCGQCGLPLRTGARFCEACGASANSPLAEDAIGQAAAGRNPRPIGEAWLSIAIGLILLFLTPNTLAFCSSKIFHTRFEPYPDPTRPAPAKCDFVLYDDGSKEFYRDRLEFWSDLAITAFAAALVFEGVTLMTLRQRWALMLALAITVAATALNLGYAIATTAKHGVPIMSLMAVAFGVYIAIQQWTNLRRARILVR